MLTQTQRNAVFTNSNGYVHICTTRNVFTCVKIASPRVCINYIYLRVEEYIVRMLQQLNQSTDEYIVCKICGKKLKIISWSHLRQHGIDIRGYKARFPNAKTTSELIATQRRKRQLGTRLSEETKNKLRNVKYPTGKAHPNYGRHHSAEHNKKMSEMLSGENSVHWGKPRSEATKKKISNALKGRYAGKNNPNYGKNASDETKLKIKENHADFSGENAPHWGKKLSPEHRQSISNSLKGKMSGKKNPAWNGGTSFKPYCYKFNETKKQEVREKYNDCDFISGLHKDVCNSGRTLDVHHVDYNKMQGCGELNWSLIPLSRRNHNRTTKYRPFWERLFIYAIGYDNDLSGLVPC